MKKLMPKGFTIIEIIIVLVIGAVIMLAVFLVVPQLQRSARNSQRQRDASAMLIAASNYKESGQTIPSGGIGQDTTSSFLNFLPRNDFKDPNGILYKIYVPTNSQYSSQNAVGRITVAFDKACLAATSNTSNLEQRPGNIAVVVPLEPFGNINRFCIDDAGK